MSRFQIPEWGAPRLSLRVTLILIVVLPLALALGGTSYAVLSVFEQFTEDRMKEDVELVARSLKMPIGRALRRGREGAVEEALQAAFSFNRVYGAYLYDENGKLIAATGGAGKMPDQNRMSKLAEEGTRTGEYDEMGGRSVYSYFVPLSTPAGRNAGLLQVVRRARDIDRAVWTLRWTAAGVFLVTVVLLSGIVLWGHRRVIGGPVDQLRRDMTKVEKGSRTHRATPRGAAEIAALGEQFNTMIEAVEKAEHTIQEREAEKRRLEEQLKRAEKLAAVGQLSAGVAHELGTPLSVVDGTAQRALRHDDVPGPVAEALRTVRAEVQKMEHIVRQLLDFGRRNPVQRRTVEARRLVDIALGSVQADVPEADELIERDGPDRTVSLSVDVGLMERVLVNLLRNALEAAPDGPVRIRWREIDDEVGFWVEDGGSGIDAEVQPRLFEPFFTTKAVGEGTGLGLAVVHSVVEEHGGRIEVGDSALGGACFRVTLPQTPGPEAAPDRRPRDSRDGGATNAR